jgi:Eukaryotic cytochrome b561
MGKPAFFDVDTLLTAHQPLTSLALATCATLIIAVLPGVYARDLFAWHPLLMTLGFLGFLREGVLAAHRFRTLEGAPRGTAIANHAWVQIAGLVCIAAGFATIYANKVGRTCVKKGWCLCVMVCFSVSDTRVSVPLSPPTSFFVSDPSQPKTHILPYTILYVTLTRK